jgi:hypothetical protein
VVRCHPADGPGFPCAGLTAEGCPLDHARPVDVAIAVREHAAAPPSADEAGVTCAIRAGVPVVVVGPPGPDSFASWAEPCHAPDDVADACGRAIDAAAERRAAPLTAEVRRLVDLRGVDVGEVSVSVHRHGDDARISVHTERPLPPGLASTVAMRVHAVDLRGTWPTTRLDIGVSSG